MTQPLLGQLVGLVALGLCIAGFAHKRDDRLLLILIFANVAFAAQFFLLGGWVAGAISALIVLRIVLVRRYKKSWPVMVAMLAATLGVAGLTWQGPLDMVPLLAGLIGTYAMFMLDGIPMRLMLAVGAGCWVLANYLSGSVGALLAESLVLATNAVTIVRIYRDRPLPQSWQGGPGTPP
ncbi:YgjV family protein [Rhodovibrio salinarum]|uniref:YgjV family protein n=1 Tax=Rhodovibrio salinarum TaxID=1087 RepID=A0A934QIN0_9PROT|nr:YgjV family protein [Rhodovibrio salinarum]MBK1697140.1 YgjV family protein [Rhodovibrio salinarum]